MADVCELPVKNVSSDKASYCVAGLKVVMDRCMLVEH